MSTVSKTQAGKRTAIVTGAAGGIGLGVSRRLAEEGYPVAMLDYNDELLAYSSQALRDEGLNVHEWVVDVSERAQVDDSFRQVREKFGPVSIIVTNAGIAAHQAFTDISSQDWDRVLAVNLTGVFHCIQAIIPDMIAAKWGRIVTISSQSAQSGAANRANYIASKGGVIALTKALASEFSPHGITVNTIPPSIVDTPMAKAATDAGLLPALEKLAMHVPVRRVSTPADIAAACAFLCSDDASFITGQQINVNGGMYM